MLFAVTVDYLLPRGAIYYIMHKKKDRQASQKPQTTKTVERIPSACPPPILRRLRQTEKPDDEK
jgi:hypothetical protein